MTKFVLDSSVAAGRAGEHLQTFGKMNGVKIAALCDPDAKRVASKKKEHSDAKTFTDLRKLIDDKEIDAVVVATSNHWHCLASIWAMQAGKDVYVEKPLSHSQWEGEQTVAAARKYNRICQVGTQQRSDPMQAEIKKFLHEEKALGKLLTCRVNRYGVRASVGKTEKPLQIDPAIDYDLWLGPAQDLPIFRKEFHYDWHWNFNTGSGEMGNWGVHGCTTMHATTFSSIRSLCRDALWAAVDLSLGMTMPRHPTSISSTSTRAKFQRSLDSPTCQKIHRRRIRRK